LLLNPREFLRLLLRGSPLFFDMPTLLMKHLLLKLQHYETRLLVYLAQTALLRVQRDLKRRRIKRRRSARPRKLLILQNLHTSSQNLDLLRHLL
jgi:hypothetical protein